jgi:hypothetical protein
MCFRGKKLQRWGHFTLKLHHYFYPNTSLDFVLMPSGTTQALRYSHDSGEGRGVARQTTMS